MISALQPLAAGEGLSQGFTIFAARESPPGHAPHTHKDSSVFTALS